MSSGCLSQFDAYAACINGSTPGNLRPGMSFTAGACAAQFSGYATCLGM